MSVWKTAGKKDAIVKLHEAANGVLSVSKKSSTTNAVVDCAEIKLDSTGTPTAGIGAGLVFKVDDAGGVEEQASIDCVLTTVTNGSEDADVVFKVNKAGTMTEMLRIDGSAQSLVVTGALAPTDNVTIASGKTLAVTTADKLTVGGVIVPQAIEVVFHAQAAAAMVDQSFFIANRAYQVTAVREVHAVAETTAASLKIQVTKDTSTDAPGAGTDLLTNNTNTGFDGKATANTVQAGTLTGTVASLQLAAGDRLSVDFEAAATELVGCTITVTLVPI